MFMCLFLAWSSAGKRTSIHLRVRRAGIERGNGGKPENGKKMPQNGTCPRPEVGKKMTAALSRLCSHPALWPWLFWKRHATEAWFPFPRPSAPTAQWEGPPQTTEHTPTCYRDRNFHEKCRKHDPRHDILCYSNPDKIPQNTWENSQTRFFAIEEVSLCWETPGQLQGSKTPSPKLLEKNSKIPPRAPTPNSLKKTRKRLKIPEK